jgi:hypothetical protein
MFGASWQTFYSLHLSKHNGVIRWMEKTPISNLTRKISKISNALAREEA